MSAALQGGIQSPLLGTLILSVAALLLGLISIGMPPTLRKTALMALPLVLLAVLVGTHGGHPALILATLLAAAGEALLMQERVSAFVTGLGVLLAVRVVYAVLFVSAANGGLFIADLWRIIAALAAAVVIASMLRRIWKYTGPLKWPSALYMLLIAVMCAAAAAVPPPAVFGGAALLAISDLVLAACRFLTPSDAEAPLAARRLAWLLRYAGQALIVLVAVGLV